MNDHAAVAAVLRDYIEAWYEGDAERMARSLHDDLAKRILAGPDAPGELRPVSKERMVGLTRDGDGNDPEGRSEVVVYDISGDIATGQVLSKESLDYAHLARTPDGWKITNIMFKTRDSAQ